MSWFDGLLGVIQRAGTAIPLGKGLNFSTGLSATLNSVTKMIDVSTVATADDYAGEGLRVDGDGLLRPQPRPRLWQLAEWFPGSNTTPNIGSHNWTLTGDGTPTITRGNVTAVGSAILQVNTDTTISNIAAVHLGPTATAGVLEPSTVRLRRWQMLIQLPALTTRRVLYGFSSSFANIDTPTNVIGLLYDSSAGPNWYAWKRAAGSGAPADTGIAANTSRALLTFEQSGSGFAVFLGATQIATTTDGPSFACNFGWGVKTLAGSAAAASCAGAWFDTELSGAYDDDTAL